MVTQPRSAAPRAPKTPLRLETLEAREVPSVGVEDVASLPQLPGMSPDYPTDAAVATVHAESRVGTPLLGTTRERFAVASAAGSRTTVNVYDSATNALLGILTPFGDAGTSGARVAVGDVTGDGVQDIIVAAGPGVAPVVKVFDGRGLTEVASFLAYDESFLGGVFVAAGSVLGDGRADIVTGAGADGGPHVKLFAGRDLFHNGGKAAARPAPHDSYFAVEADFRGGVSVAVADVNGDGFGDIVAGAGPGGGPRVVVVSGKDGSRLEDFFAYAPTLRSGVMVAAGTLDASGLAKIVTVPMAGGGADVKVFGGGKLEATYQPFATTAAGNGVAVRDLDGDGRGDILVTSGPGTRPRILALDGATGRQLRDFPGLTPDYLGGLYVG